MKIIRKYFLPVAAGASLVVGLAAVSPLPANAKATKPPSIKVSPKSVVESATGTTVTVTGKNFPAGASGSNLVECLIGASGQSQCDIATATPVSITNGSFTASFKFLSTSYVDAAKDSCTTAKKPIKTCGIAAGNQSMSVEVTPVAVTIKK
jgi:hypothetical protein